jgi:TolA-binding protein
MFKSVWWSHIPNIDTFPVIVGSEPEKTPEQIAAEAAAGVTNPSGGAGGEQQQELDPQKKIAALTEEKDRHWTLAQEAKSKLTEAERELEELRQFKLTKEQESLSDDEKVAAKVLDLETKLAEKDVEIEKVKESARKLVLNNAFLAQNDVKWHNAERALALADLSEVEIVDNNGVPTLKDPSKMKAAIEALAKSDAYLVDTSEKPPSWEGNTGDKPLKPTVKSEASKREKLLKEYPALRR